MPIFRLNIGMPNCAPNTLFISSAQGCQGQPSVPAGCSDLGPMDCHEGAKLGPRRNRGRVIEQLKDYVKLMLGAPVVTLELDEQQLDLAVKATLKIAEYYAPREFFKYYFFRTVPGKSVYQLPPAIAYIRQVYYRETPEFAFTAADLGGSIPVEYFYPGGAYATAQGGMIDPIQPIWGRAGEWSLYKAYEHMYSTMSSAIGGWEFVGGYSQIKLYPIPLRAHAVFVWYMEKCHDWENIEPVLMEGALAHAKIMLGRVRSKYASPPGPGGGLQLDGERILQEGLEEYKQWKEDLVYKWGDLLGPSLG